ncbi:MAG: hypothetical protein ACI4O4_05035 [Candidatus Ventricola sp.]
MMQQVIKDGKIIRDIAKSVAGNRGSEKEEPEQERRAKALRSCHAQKGKVWRRFQKKQDKLGFRFSDLLADGLDIE